MTFSFSERDRVQLRQRGIAPEDAQHQLGTFAHPPKPVRIDRPCTVGDGIHPLSEADIDRLIRRFEEARAVGRVTKFVPASGAASRMFKSLSAVFGNGEKVTRKSLPDAAAAGNTDAKAVQVFFDGLPNLGFYDEVAELLRRRGMNAEALLSKGEYTEILAAILTDRGLEYAEQPKALIKFHRYPDGSRTALEEHLVEAVQYAKDDNGVCRVHLTVGADDQVKIASFLARVLPAYEERYRVTLQVDSSVQKASTDTLAVTPDNQPFRAEDGSLFFRPGGHGALLDNLNDLNGDIVFIKNIDNVVPDRLKPINVRWKKAIGGLLSSLQAELFRLMGLLESRPEDEAALRQAEKELRDRFGVSLPDPAAAPKIRGEELRRLLNRPLRVCGVVKKTGEPGGGPFWVRAASGELSLQIVEEAQIDSADSAQKAVFATSTHFNPVDLVCGLRDWKRQAFDLHRFVEPDAVFIAQKSHKGQDLKALEWPGLWNGAMAHWNTVFVEVPIETFNPVKTVNDLLREAHQ